MLAAMGLLSWLLLLVCASAGHAQTGQLLFDEEFNNSINTSIWNVHDGTWNIQRTKFGKAPTIVTEGSTTFARFGLDTYNPNDPGNTCLGTEMWSNQQFSMGTGVDFQARVRGTNVPPGLVQSFFTYKQRNFATDHDQEEVDYEFLGNQLQTSANSLWLNIWNNASSNSSNPAVSGLNSNSWATWNTYDIYWLNNQVEWLVNGTVVRTETNLMPDTYMSLCFNLWAATSDWSNAYNSSLVTATSAATSKNYYFDVDYVRVYSIPATGSGVTGNGTGLSGVFFNNTALTTPVFTQLAPRVNYNWGSNSPDSTNNSAIGNQWSARWSGQVQAQFSEPYTFYANAEDGVRLYVNNQQIINKWQNQSSGAVTTTSSTINLVAGQWYDIRMEFYSSTSNATAQLFWSSTSTTKQLVPDTQLSPYATTPVFSVPAGTYYKPQTVTVSDATIGATIYYTTDGTDPTTSSPTIASGASLPSFTSATTLKAIAVANGYYNSPINNTLYTVINDTTPPTVAVSSPITTYSYTSLTTTNGTANDTGGSGLQSVTGRFYRYSDNTYWNGTAWTATPVELPATGTSSWTLNLPSVTDGHYAIRATATDAAGNSAASSVVDFFIDTTPPTATITAPTATAFSSLGQASGTAVDVGPGVAQVTGRLFRYVDNSYWNGNAWTATPADVVATGTSAWGLPLPPLSDGRYAFSAAASDYAGNTAATTPFDFYIDSTPPIAALANLPFNSSYRSLAQVTGTASDAATSVVQVRGRLYRYADGTFWNGAAWGGVDTDSPAQGTTSWTFALPALTDGKYSFRADAVDAAGNVGSSSANDFYIDNVPPTVTVTNPIANSLFPSAFVAAGTASDAVPGVQQVTCSLLRYSDNTYWNGSAWTATSVSLVASGTTNWTYNLPALGDGKYSLVVAASDFLGNASAPVGTDFLVDATPPTVTISAPANNATVTSLPYVAGAAQDNLSGVNAVTLLLQRRTDGLYWNGSAWSGTPAYLSALLSTQSTSVTWVVRSGLPGGATLPDGPYTLTAIAVDATGANGATGNGRGTVTQNFTVQTIAPTPTPAPVPTPTPTPADTIAPTVAFTSIKQGATVQSLPYVVGQVADNTGGSGVARVDFVLQRRSDRKYWNGTAWSSAATRLATTVSGATWVRRTGLPSGANLSAGQYVLQAAALDRAANGRTVTITITVAQPVPLRLKFVWPATGATLPSLTYAAGQVTGDGVTRVDLTLQRRSDSKYWNGTAWVATSTALTTTLSGANWVRRTGLPSGANLLPGAYALQAIAYNQAGSKLAVALAITIKGTSVKPTPVPTPKPTPAPTPKPTPVPPPAPTPTPAGPGSTVRLSTAAATSVTGSVLLRFTGALNASLASDPAHFQVTVNGQAVTVESAAYVGNTNTVLLSLPEGALQAGDRVVTRWLGLRDATGRTLVTATSQSVAQ